MTPNYKNIDTIEQLNSIVKYCESWVGHYFTEFQINGFTPTKQQLEIIKNKLIEKNYTIKPHINSHNVVCFWVLK